MSSTYNSNILLNCQISLYNLISHLYRDWREWHPCFTPIVLATASDSHYEITLFLTWILTVHRFPIAYLWGHQGILAAGSAEYVVLCRRLSEIHIAAINPLAAIKSSFYGLHSPRQGRQGSICDQKLWTPLKPSCPAKYHPFLSAHIFNSGSRIE